MLCSSRYTDQLANISPEVNMTMPSTIFKVGDSVVSPAQGAGRIVAQIERQVAGKTFPYFEIELVKGSTRVLIPIADGDRNGLRRITDAKQIPELMNELKQPDIDLPNGWTPRHRREQQILAEGDIFKIAHMVGTLYRRDIEKSLSNTEHKMLEDARSMVVTEVALSLDISLEEANTRIEKALEY
jgi:CarD family transcriptional regulator